MALKSMADAAAIIIPEALLPVNTMPLRGILEELLQRLDDHEVALRETGKELKYVKKRQDLLTSLATRVDKLEQESSDQISKSQRNLMASIERRLDAVEEYLGDLEKKMPEAGMQREAPQKEITKLHEDTKLNSDRLEALKQQFIELRKANALEFVDVREQCEDVRDACQDNNRHVEKVRVDVEQLMQKFASFDLNAYRHELNDSLRKVEASLRSALDETASRAQGESERLRSELDAAMARFRAQLSETQDSGMQDMIKSLKKYIAMMTQSSSEDAAGTTCIVCRKDRAQSPIRSADYGIDGHVYVGMETLAPTMAPERLDSTVRTRRAVGTPAAARQQLEHQRPASGRASRPGSGHYRPGSGRGTSNERYDLLLENYTRMINHSNDKAIGKLVGIT